MTEDFARRAKLERGIQLTEETKNMLSDSIRQKLALFSRPEPSLEYSYFKDHAPGMVQNFEDEVRKNIKNEMAATGGRIGAGLGVAEGTVAGTVVPEIFAPTLQKLQRFAKFIQSGTGKVLLATTIGVGLGSAQYSLGRDQGSRYATNRMKYNPAIVEKRTMDAVRKALDNGEVFKKVPKQFTGFNTRKS
ncbi:MAG: hypothetical protein LBJ00_15285 [Planctomycetaceae bacterium]|jgi:hypothetical protein|nr:hypothetical protein [Planctomycetaceae bacterium]